MLIRETWHLMQIPAWRGMVLLGNPICADGCVAAVVGPSYANSLLAQGRRQSLREKEALGVANI